MSGECSCGQNTNYRTGSGCSSRAVVRRVTSFEASHQKGGKRVIIKAMKVRYIGHTSPCSLTYGEEYSVESIECGWYRIRDEHNDDYLYPPKMFEVVEATPAPIEIEPALIPAHMRSMKS